MISTTMGENKHKNGLSVDIEINATSTYDKAYRIGVFLRVMVVFKLT